VLYPLDLPDASLIKSLETKIVTFSADHGWFESEKASNALDERSRNAGAAPN